MSIANSGSKRTLGWDWYDGTVPENVMLAESAFLETTYSFLLYRSELREGVRIGQGSTVYLGTMFDVGRRGRVSIGEFALINGAWFICDEAVEIGDYALISWNRVFMDTYRMPIDPAARRGVLQGAVKQSEDSCPEVDKKTIRVGRNVWIGFDCCIIPGVSIGEGAIIGA